MNHVEQWIVPLNLFMIAAAVVLWGVSFPLWTTFVIAVPLALILAWFGIDKYGGMQIVMLIAPAFLAAIIVIGKKYRDAIAAQEDVRVGSLIIEFIGTIVVLPIVLFAIVALFVEKRGQPTIICVFSIPHGFSARCDLLASARLHFRQELAQMGFSNAPALLEMRSFMSAGPGGTNRLPNQFPNLGKPAMPASETRNAG